MTLLLPGKTSCRVQSRSKPRTKVSVVGLSICGLLLLASSALAQTTVLPRNSDWKYDDTGTDLGTAWRAADFDDSGWDSGPGPLGYGESWIETVVSFGGNAADKNRTTYFRAEFEITEDPVNMMTLMLRANFDDGAVFYINGVEATRENMPAGEILYSTFSSGNHEGGAYEFVDISSSIGLLEIGTNSIAVEVHQVSMSSSDLAWDGELLYSTEPAFIMRGPYLQVGKTDGVTVRWRTDTAVESQVRYGTSPDLLDQSVLSAALTTEHEVELSGLAAGTTYYYAVGTSTSDLVGGDTDHRFRTHPNLGDDGPTRVWIIGDSGEYLDSADLVRDAYLGHPGSENTDVWLMLGDNAYDSGTDGEYQAAVFEMYPQLLRNTILWPTRGNHDDLRSGSNNDYYEFFTMPTAGQSGGLASGTEAYYSFDYGNIHFICLDSDGSSRLPAGPMMTWLTNDIAATTQDWVIAFWHHPPYTKGSHDSDDPSDSSGRMRDMRERALPILEGTGVDLVFSGHSHSYERSHLLNGHYGLSTTLDPSMVLDPLGGSPNEGGAYVKPSGGPAPNAGAVYSVPGSSSKTSGGPLNHPAMYTSLNILGSVVLDIDGDQLDAVFIDETGAVRDEYSIVKIAPADAPDDGATLATRVEAFPNPFGVQVNIAYRLVEEAAVAIEIHDATGRRVWSSAPGRQSPGEHRVVWNGSDDEGRRLPAGTYFAVIDMGEETRARRISLIR